MQHGILIIDYGSQYTQLIARRIREIKVYCSIHPFNKISEDLLNFLNPKGVILSGGPNSVLDNNSPNLPISLKKKSLPILGICYGLQLLAYINGGKIKKSFNKEYGYAKLNIINNSNLIPLEWNIKNPKVWMSHGDNVNKIPKNFKIIAKSNNNIISIIENKKNNIYGLQFHPEVHHTEFGEKLLKNFALKICKANQNWIAKNFLSKKIKEIKNLVKNKKVICGISGGVDSTVTAFLLNKAIGKKLYCIFIDNGFLRKNESHEVISYFKEKFNNNFLYIDASKIFFKKLYNVKNPEKKRMIIGKTFIEVFNRESKKIGNVNFLAQGTLYPDVIESISFFGGPTAKIKTHHNVGALPKKMNLRVVEPLRELFKDEVREIGRKLGIEKKLILRHPFPGPGLAIRIPGRVTKEKVLILQNADEIYINFLKEKKIYNNIWQAFAVLLPTKSVGVMGDQRTYNYTCSLRAVTSVDGMTADFYLFTKDQFTEISNRIINNVKGINRVLFDFTTKPPGTIEWE